MTRTVYLKTDHDRVTYIQQKQTWVVKQKSSVLGSHDKKNVK